MIERGKGLTSPHAFLIAIDCQPGVDMERIKFALSDAVSWMEGAGKSDVEYLGPIDVYNEPEAI
jgi:hypothetical protein